MPTLINTQEAQAPAQGSSNAGGDNNALMKISAGPAALAQLLIYEIMQLYGQILALDQKQKVSMVQAQSKEAQASAQATEAGGHALMVQYIVSGSLTLGGAVAGFGIQERLSSTGEGEKAAKAETAAQNKFESMQSIEEAMTAKSADVVGGPAQNKPQPNEDEVLKRMAEFKKNNFSNAKQNQAATEEAVKRMKTPPVQNVNNVQNDNNAPVERFDYDNWKNDFQENKIEASRNYNSAVQRRSNVMTTITAYKNLAEQGAQAGSSGVTAWGSAEKSKQDAAQALQQSASQMAGAASSDLGQAANKAFESQNAEIQVLENINRTNSVNG